MNNENNRDSVEELLKDKSFRNWVINNDPESATFWKSRLENEPDLKQNILFAKHFLLNLQEQPVAISANEIEELAIQITNQAAESKLVFWKNPALRIAASLVILFGFGLLVYNYQNKEKVVANDSSYVKSEVTTKKVITVAILK